MLAAPGDRFVAGAFDDRDGEEGADAGADDIGIEDVGSLVAEDDGGDAGAVGSAEHGSKVAGFLDRLGDQIERGAAGGWLRHVGKPPATLRGDCQDAFGTFPVGNLLEDRAAAFKDFSAPGLETGDQGRFVFA